MMKTKTWVILCLCSLLVGSFVLAVQNKGAENITIFGGARGNIPFPHQAHQNSLGDCNICHSIFPQESAALKTLKSKDQLKPKEVMNKLCIKCHKAEKNAGNKAGPTTCSKCHVR